MDLLKLFAKKLPTLLTAILLAIAVWILAVTNTDPVEKHIYGKPVELEVVGLDSSLLITSDLPAQVSLTLSAPVSTWSNELNTSGVIRATLDLSGKAAGSYSVPVEIQINARPVKVESYTPESLEVRLEQLYSEAFTIKLVQPSSPAVGYEAGTPELSIASATVSGPASQVDKVVDVSMILDISQAKEDINRDLELQALDANGLAVSDVTISPEKVNVKIPISQRGGYRNLSVWPITKGQPASGYLLTNIQVNPLVVTVYSANPELINNLPGYIETEALNLTDAKDDLEVSLPLAVPSGINVVGESVVKVSVSISPIQGSLTLSNIPIEVTGISDDYEFSLSPDRVEIIFSGPLPDLNDLNATDDVRVLFDLTGYTEGIYRLEPLVNIAIPGILVESKLPEFIEVVITPITQVTAQP
jgi:YbbR domain-containing protein